jgi:hypothetical protein
MVKAIHTALDARRQRIVVSQSAVGTVKWAGILLQGLRTLVAIAMPARCQRTSVSGRMIVTTCRIDGNHRYGVVTLSQTERNLPTTANVDAWNSRDLARWLIVQIGPISLNVTMPSDGSL